MIDLMNFEVNGENNNLICPNETCISIPEILYSQDFLSSNIIHKCNSCQKKGKNAGNSEISKFLLQSSKIRCSICFAQIIHNFFCYYCTKCKNICHNFCDKNHQENILQINNIYNICLEHNRPFISRCVECNISLCKKCEDENICKLIHHIISFEKIVQNQNEKEQKIMSFEKQKYYLNKIIEINQDIIQSLKNDIDIKEKIIMNYLNNKNNYESILNFNNLHIENNDKYEAILENIIIEYEKVKNNNNSNINSIINQMLCPLYFSLMINKDENIHCSVCKELEKIISDNNDKQKEPNNNNEKENKNNHLNGDHQNKYYNKSTINSYNSIINKKMNKTYLWDNNNKNILSVNYNNLYQKTKNIKFIKKNANSNSYKEIKDFQYKKKINNIIILKSGNIAISSYGMIEIFNKDLIYQNINKNQLLIRIELEQKKPISYMHQLPDETFLFGTFSKIFRIELYEEYKNYDVLEFIKIENSELVTKIISFGQLFFITLSLHNKSCKLRLSTELNHYKYLISKNNNTNTTNNNPINKHIDNINSENDSKPILEDDNKNKNNNNEVNDEKNDLNRNDIQINKISLENNNTSKYISKYFVIKEFFKNYSGDTKLKRKFEISNNFNTENISFTSICEIKYNNNKNNIDNNGTQILHEFIATSNSIIEKGKDIIQFFSLKSKDCYLIIAKTKKIENISCSIESDSICQLNENYICVGLQNFNIIGQKSGFALIDINQKNLNKIIEDNEIFYVNFIKEKNLLLTSMAFRNFEGFYNMIKVYDIQVDGNNKITFKTRYEFKCQHKGKIISIFDIESHCFGNKLLNNNFTCVSASVDGNIKIINSDN